MAEGLRWHIVCEQECGGVSAEYTVRAILKRLWARRWLRWAAIVALPGLALLSVLGVELTSTNRFCNTCHIMNTFYASWQASSHKDVECVQCHIPPGLNHLVLAKLNGLGQAVDDILARTSTQPSASVSDSSCTRSGCHDLSAVRAVPRREKPYIFEHAKHLDLAYQGIEVHCATCHSHIKGEKHFEVNAAVCVTCHLLSTPAPPAQVAQGAPAGGAEGKILPVSSETPPAPAKPQAGAKEGIPSFPGEGGMPTPLLRGHVFREGDSMPSERRAGHASRVDEGSPGKLGTSANKEAPVKAEAPAKTAPTLCRNCHLPPDKPVQYRGLKVVHAEYAAYGAACESCHRGVTAAPDPIRDDRCLGCHDFGKERVTSVPELHKVHSEGRHKVECFSCHGVIRHGPSAQTMRLEQIDCRACHRGQHEIQQKTYKSAGETAHQPAEGGAVTPMFLAHVDCTGCHVQQRAMTGKAPNGETVAVATPEACDTCHKAGLGKQMIPLWQKNTHALYDNVVRMLPDPAKPTANPKAGQLVAQARHLLELVKMDGSWGVHNPPYTQKLIEQAKDKLSEAMGASAQADRSPSGAEGAAVSVKKAVP